MADQYVSMYVTNYVRSDESFSLWTRSWRILCPPQAGRCYQFSSL